MRISDWSSDVCSSDLNQTAVLRGGSVGVFGDKAAEDTPFSIKTHNEALILNQQPQTLGQVLENDPSVRTTLGFGIAGELFVIRGFALSGDDVGFRSEEHTSELQSLMRISYAVFCLKKKNLHIQQYR